MSSLVFDHVTYTYPGAGRPSLSDVTFTLEPGEFCLLAGLSGHGKSSLLRAACGLAPHFHGGRFAGTVKLAGLDTREHGPARLGALAGALFQDPESQLVMSSVRAELALALESRGHAATAVARGVEEVALALGIDHLLDRPTHTLSGGEQQRVALGAALAGRPPVLLLDEPTSQLDPVAGDELIGLLRRLNQEWDVTILLAEHRLERCLTAADRVLAMRDGRLANDGPPSQFLEWAAHAAPALQTPGAQLFSHTGLAPPPVGVKQARAVLRSRCLLSSESVSSPSPPAVLCVNMGNRRQGAPSLGPPAPPQGSPPTDAGGVGATNLAIPAVVSAPRSGAPPGRRWAVRRGSRGRPALRLRGVWHELHRGPAILRGVDLQLQPGETVALMGRNGAGKSTLLRHAAGLLAPTRGRIERGGRVALLLQNPGDYLIHERVAREASPAALARAGLTELAERHPRDLSGGERQRLALAIVTDGEDEPAVVALDEPTRGMDRDAKAQLADDLRARAARGEAVIVATHDPEFACVCAERAVLLADGRPIADGPIAELLAGGWYFATETARILSGADGALTPEQGAAALARWAAGAGSGTRAEEGRGREPTDALSPAAAGGPAWSAGR
ncbi:MAG TPA: ATP-binding cassette domain-containing protein [Solirubrobacteraceae bacterium]|nr:ATP-binding cassette domain-containing protein [Solirubrobacteraceae bacterium]